MRTLSAAQAARIIGVGTKQIANMARQGELRVVGMVASAGSPARRFDADEVEEVARRRNLPRCGFCEQPMTDPVLFDPTSPLGAHVCVGCRPVLERRIAAVKAARELIEEG